MARQSNHNAPGCMTGVVFYLLVVLAIVAIAGEVKG